MSQNILYLSPKIYLTISYKYARIPNEGDFAMTSLRSFWNDEQGQDLIEYTLFMCFVALASAAFFLSFGGNGTVVWQQQTDVQTATGVKPEVFRTDDAAPWVRGALGVGAGIALILAISRRRSRRMRG
jgi:Flp pilus assembly pilin Flp